MSDKLDLKTPDMVNLNKERIAALFPHCVTEVAVDSGNATIGGATLSGTPNNTVTRKIDFDLLRQELSADIVEGPKERYRLEWPGKREAIVTANMPTTNTLRPVREDSVNFDTTENLYIEGDNLEVLKLLQESYLGKIKMIYIDPPYNTGNDFVYRDNFAQNAEEFKADSGMTDELGNRLVPNPETAGRYHSDWLTMMYPRLKLARNLLTDDGVIFISIDDNEVHNLRKMCDEVFGEVNFVANVVWEKIHSTKNDAKYFSENHEYLVVYSKSIENVVIKLLPRTETMNERYKNIDNDYRGPWQSGDLVASGERTNGHYIVTSPKTGKVFDVPQGKHWVYAEDNMKKMIDDDQIWFGIDGNSFPRKKRFLNDVQDGRKPDTLWMASEVGHNQTAARELKAIFDEQKYFDFPKPTEFIKQSVKLITDSDSIILDFFSGAGTTAHAVMQLNSEDGGNRRFIMVQLPEKTDEKSEAYKAGYKNICQIGKERIRRAGKLIAAQTTPAPQPPKGGAESANLNLFSADSAGSGGATLSGTPTQTPTQKGVDIGFRVYRLDTSNMQDVYYRPQDYKQEMMTELFANHIKPDRTPDDLVAQVMLDWGLPLSLPIEQTSIAGKTVYKVAGNALYCCFDEGIDEEFVKALVSESAAIGGATLSGTPNTALPLRIVFHDYAFANDTAKENVRQLLKQLSAETEMRVM